MSVYDVNHLKSSQATKERLGLDVKKEHGLYLK